MADDRHEAAVASERWFEAHGLPYFIDDDAHRVDAALAWKRIAPIVGADVLVSVAAGVLVATATGDAVDGLAVGALVLGVVALLYAFAALHFLPILRWAVRQTFGSLGWVFPLIARALPLLLLFITFLFINTEVWQVTSALSRAFLWLAVMLFAGVAVAFLLVRLPEEVRDVSKRARGDELVSICADTPVAAVAADVVRELGNDAQPVEPSRLQRANLVLVLLFAQALQVMLLSLSVFCFFILFGLIAIKDSVIRGWLCTAEVDCSGVPHHLPSLDWMPVSNELFQVSVFLAAFSGLYFTVYAVSDQNYRRQFFADISHELETAIGVHRIYQALRTPRL